MAAPFPLRQRIASRFGASRRVAAAVAAAAFLFCHVPAGAETALVLKSKDIGPYNMALQGFTRAYRGKVEIVDVEKRGARNLPGNPDMAVVIGNRALQAALRLPRSVPLVLLMILNPDSDILRGRSFVGVKTVTPAADYLAFIEKNFPELPRVGVLAGNESALEAAAYGGVIKVEVGRVGSLQKVPEVFRELLPRVDAFLVMPDRQVVSKETIQFILLNSIEARKPVFVYSDAMVKAGAFLSLTASYDMLGTQAADIVKDGTEGLQGRKEWVAPSSISVNVNEEIAGRIGVAIPAAVRSRAGN